MSRARAGMPLGGPAPRHGPLAARIRPDIMSTDARATRPTAQALAECLYQLATLIASTTDEDYAWRHPSGVSGSVGAHVRHCLDHVHALVEADGDRLTYDARSRGTRAERDRAYAIERLTAAAQVLAAGALRAERQILLDVQVDRDGTLVSVVSSFGRELAFVLQHTIHHQALIALLLADRGTVVPATFGLAPATPLASAPPATFVPELACAR